MESSNGWISCENHEEKILMKSGEIKLLGFFESHRTLLMSIREDNEQELFVICVGCKLMEIKLGCRVNNLCCKKIDTQDYLLYSEKEKLQVGCTALRVEAIEFMKKWMAGYGFNYESSTESDALRFMSLIIDNS